MGLALQLSYWDLEKKKLNHNEDRVTFVFELR